MSDLTKRIVVRLSEAQLAFVEQAAADEGMDNATLVRVILDRLSKGRPPLIGMMQAVKVELPSSEKPQALASFLPADDILAQRAAEAEQQIEVEEPQGEVAAEAPGAIPLRVVARTVYNPGRS